MKPMAVGSPAEWTADSLAADTRWIFTLDDRARRDLPGRAAAVLDRERLAETLLQTLGKDPRQDVGRAARGIPDHELDRPGRIVERKRTACRGSERGCAEQSQCGAT